jgi:hypothetical protein
VFSARRDAGFEFAVDDSGPPIWNHIKGCSYVGSNAIVVAEALLTLLQRMDADELTIHWQP